MSKPSARILCRPWAWALAGLAAVLLLLKFAFHVDLVLVQTKLVLRPTALTLEDVRDLEFLVTAEYFGEVIGTARDYFSKTAVPAAEAVLSRLAADPRPEDAVLSDEDRKIFDALRAALIRRSRLSARVIDTVKSRTGVLSLVRPEFANGRLGDELREALLAVLLERRDIAYLARGIVQAGYNLAAVEEDRFLRSRDGKTVYLQMEPTILGKAINPWFIYDPAANLQIKGFEIIAESNVDLEEDDAFSFINGVKEACRQRLLEDALKAGIEDRARASAEQSLANLFKMFQPDIEAVRLVGRGEFERRRAEPPDGRP
ncbi:MAG: DUF4230 domain-containing protein [Candidatus Aminicenantes bacterium]|nr:DUF4230 domain-containing protein [Candidatus Aminicenantes bacterium]